MAVDWRVMRVLICFGVHIGGEAKLPFCCHYRYLSLFFDIPRGFI